MKLGTYVYGLAAIATGIIDIVWGGFESAHQPIQAFGDNVPGRQTLAYIVAALLVAGGASVLWRQTARFGAVALALVYAIFAIFWMPRFYTAPLVLGFHASEMIGVLGGVCEQLIIIAAASLVYARASPTAFRCPQRTTSFARWIFGLSSLDFGLAHLTSISSTAALVPKWIPPAQNFWAVLTGIAFVLAGIAILTKILNLLAARLLALMLVIFSALALAPLIFKDPHNQVAWGANGYNLIAAASVWIFAASIAARQVAGSAREDLVRAGDAMEQIGKVMVLFIAGFGPIIRDVTASRKLYRETLGIRFKEEGGGYLHTEALKGANTFALWPLSQAAQSCFGKDSWPDEIPSPQSWLEFDVDSVEKATAELEARGYRMLVKNKKEPWGQTVSRFLAPEGLLIGITFTPSMRERVSQLDSSGDA